MTKQEMEEMENEAERFCSVGYYYMAIPLFQTLAENGSATAQYNLGYCYYTGREVNKDYEQAAYWYTKAAEQGHEKAQYYLGTSYLNGLGVSQDDEKAMHWYAKAAEQGNTASQLTLGLAYNNGHVFEKNPEQAVYWFTKAAEQEHEQAQYELGTCYLSGEGVSQDNEKAVYWYAKAAELDHEESQYILGLAYFSGIGIEADHGQAVYWMKKAAEQGNDDAKKWLKKNRDVVKQAAKAVQQIAPEPPENKIQYEEPEMIFVEGGTFIMGNDQKDEYSDGERPVHKVTLSSFNISKYPVTYKQWRLLMGTTGEQLYIDMFSNDRHGPIDFLLMPGTDDDYPMYCVSWEDAQEYVERLNKAAGKQYRLPTEAEWEYAARGGNKSKGYKFSGSDNADDVAYYNRDHLCNVGTKKPNELGIHDMSGCIWEWCSDGYRNYTSSPQHNPKGPANETGCMLRGGAWNSGGDRVLRNTYRLNVAKHVRDEGYGFRLVVGSEQGR